MGTISGYLYGFAQRLNSETTTAGAKRVIVIGIALVVASGDFLEAGMNECAAHFPSMFRLAVPAKPGRDQDRDPHDEPCAAEPEGLP